MRWIVMSIAVALAVVTLIFVGARSPIVGGAPIADSTVELQAQLDALEPGGSLKLDERVYEHSGVIRLRVPGVNIDGNGATLHATNDATSSVQIMADGVNLTNVKLTAATEGQRFSGLDQQRLVVAGDRDTVRNVSVVGSAAAGIFVTGARNFSIQDVDISGTRADGLHITGGSRNGTVSKVTTAQTGDDGVAVVSYESDGVSCGNLQITGVRVESTRYGRGISVVGGQDVSIRDFAVANTDAAGIYIASEGKPFFTRAVRDVTVAGGSVTAANQNPNVVQGAMLVYSGNAAQQVTGVQISDVAIAATPASADRNVGIVIDAGSADGISFDGIRLTNSTVSPFFSNAPAGAHSSSGWTLDGNPLNVD